MSCRWNGTGEPRTLAGRHDDDCADEETCRGCQPCTAAHCRVCGVAHVPATGSCPGCVDEARSNLAEIGRMCAALPDEVEHRGVEGEAFVLLGPCADPEARGHLEASVLAGRVPPEYLEQVTGELHPTFLAERWGSVYREAFDHDEPLGRVDLADELGYLGRNLTYMAAFEWVPFEDLVRDLRRCVGHLQAVLHDQDRGERANVSCFDCGGDLERMLGPRGFDDRWTCRGRGCGRRYTIAEYNFALRAALEESA